MTDERGAQQRKRRRKSTLRIHQIAQLARDFYVEGKTKKAIAKEKYANGLSAIQVAQVLDTLFETNVVAIDIDETYALTGEHCKDLSTRLRGVFKLRDAYVIDASVHLAAINDDRRERRLRPLTELQMDSALHLALANVTAQITFPKLASEVHLAVGGGRAIYRFCEWMRRRRPSAQGVMITPLSAGLWAGNWQVGSSGLLEAPLDPDDAALILAQAFQHDENEAGARFSRFGYTIYAASVSEAKRILETYSPLRVNGDFAPAQGVAADVPNMAFVGVGVLDKNSGHRIARFLDQPENVDGQKLSTPVDPVRKEIVAAMELVEKHGLPHIGDIANRFFPVLPLPSILGKWSSSDWQKRLRAYDKLVVALRELNDRAIVCNWTHLRRIPSVRILAAGLLKTPALWTILITDLISRTAIGEREPYRRLVSEVTIDKATADAILREYDIYQEDPALQDKYEALVQRLQLFSDRPLRRN